MTDISGVSGGTTAQTPSTSTPTDGASTGSGALGTAQVRGQEVTITQPDGSTFTYTIPTGRMDDKGNVIATPAEGMSDFAKQNNRKYGQSLDADDFMKLLVAQLQYQDPSKPADTTAMMQQTASMAMLERVNEMTSSTEALSKAAEAMAESNAKLVASNEAMTSHLGSLFAQQSLSAAIGMIGQKVTYTTGSGDSEATAEGLVESVKIGADGPILTVNGTDVPITSLVGVSGGAAAPATTANTTGSGAAETAASTATPGATTAGTTTTDAATTGTSPGISPAVGSEPAGTPASA